MLHSHEATVCPKQSALRLRVLQAAVQREGLDALVLIPGLDGNNNRGSLQAVGYVLGGLCGRSILDTVQIRPELADIILVIGPSSVGLYATPTAHQYLWPLVAPGWQNLELICSTEEELQDQELLDACKIASFVSLLHGKSKLGFTLTPAVNTSCERTMEIEKWPLIQAYGLEGIGKPGFFSMNFEVKDMYGPLHDVYANLDSHDVRQLLSNSQLLLMKHWHEVIQGIGMCQPGERKSLSERQIGEPLLSYYAYGTLRPTPGVQQILTMMPRVIFGQRSNSDKEQSSTLTAAAAGTVQGEPCSHFVVEAADPKSPLRAARTYFFTAGRLPITCMGDEIDDFHGSEEDKQILQSWTDNHTPELMRLYAALAEAVKAAIAHFCSNCQATAQSARQVAFDTVISASKARGVPLCQDSLASQLRYAMWAADHTNAITPAPKRGLRKLKVLRIAIHDVKLSDGSIAGGLVYADTFLEAAENKWINLTDLVPTFHSFPATSGEVVAITKLEALIRSQLDAKALQPATSSVVQDEGQRGTKDFFSNSRQKAVLKAPQEGQVLGALINSGEDDVILLTGMDEIPYVAGRLTCFSAGIVFQGRYLPPLVIDFRSHLDGVWMDKLGDQAGDIIVLKGKSPACGLLPASLLGDNPCLGIALAHMRASSRRHLTIEVLGAWEQACREMDIPVGNSAGVAAFPVQLREAHCACVLKAAKQYQVVQPDYQVVDCLEEIDASIAGSMYPVCDAAVFQLYQGQSPVGIVLITGLPGAQQQDVALAMIKFASETSVWKVVQPSLQAGLSMDTTALQTEMSTAVEQILHQASSALSLRIALVIETFACLETQLEALAACRPCMDGMAHLDALIVCCNAASLQNIRRSIPFGFMEQLKRGLVDRVVLAGSSSNADAMNLLRLRLPGVPVIRASRGQLIRNMDMLLRVDHGTGAGAAPLRGVWAPSRTFPPSVQCVHLKCTGSLDVSSLCDSLRRWGLEDDPRTEEPLQVTDVSADPRLIAVHAFVRPTKTQDVQVLSGMQKMGIRVGPWPLLQTPWAVPPSSVVTSDQAGAELMLCGFNLVPAMCKELVANCAMQPKKPAPLRTVASITHDERLNIAAKCQYLSLPEGYYFDGVSYLDTFGERLQEHPCLPDLLEQYVSDQNDALSGLKNFEHDDEVFPLVIETACLV